MNKSSINDLTIRNCPFRFRCTQKWSQLQETPDSLVRFCGECQKNVHYCSSDGEIAAALRSNKCVAMEIFPSLGKPAEDEFMLLGF